MRILSIDVGIVNLALCLIEIKDNKYKILFWDTINLCNESYICKEKLKKKFVTEKQNIVKIIFIIVNHVLRKVIILFLQIFLKN